MTGFKVCSRLPINSDHDATCLFPVVGGGLGFAFLAKRSRLAFAFAFNFLKTCREQFDLLDQHVDDRLLLLKQRLAIRAIGGDLGHIHDPQILIDLGQIHQHQFFAR